MWRRKVLPLTPARYAPAQSAQINCAGCPANVHPSWILRPGTAALDSSALPLEPLWARTEDWQRTTALEQPPPSPVLFTLWPVASALPELVPVDRQAWIQCRSPHAAIA